MAFNMNRPIIKGTPFHKASVAKAKSESIVAAAEQGADSTLVGAGKELGLSNVGQSIDFGIESTKLDWKKKKKKKATTEEKELTAAELQQQKNREEYAKEHPDGTLFPDGKWYDVNGDEIKKKDGKNIKEEKTPTDNAFNDVDKDGNVVSRLFGRARQAVRDKKLEKEANFQASQKEQAKIDTAATNFTVNKEDLVLVDGKWGPKEGAISKEDDHAIFKDGQWTDNPKYMDKADVSVDPKYLTEEARKKREQMNKKPGQYMPEPPKVAAVGGKQINQYSKEQRDRLQTEGEGRVWSDDLGRYVLSEEIVGGEFVTKAEGPEVKMVESEKDWRGAHSTPEENAARETTTTSEKPKQSDFRNKKNPFGGLVTAADQQKKALKAWYAAGNTDSPLEKQDDRIWNGAIKGGKVHENMRKSGYIPKNEI